MFTVIFPLGVPSRPQRRVTMPLAALPIGRIAEIKVGIIEGSADYHLGQSFSDPVFIPFNNISLD